jgi:hypothetical protein
MNKHIKKPSHLDSPEDRFDAAVERQGECLIYKGKDNGLGYCQIKVRGRRIVAHRFSYERFVGPIPEGMSLDHVCHNRRCVEPKHLRPVTTKQNLENLAGAYKGSGTGVRGVSFDPKGSGRYRATVTHNYRTIRVGSFRTLEEAEAAVVAKRLELFTHNDLDRVA